MEICDLVFYLFLDRFSNLIDADAFDGHVDAGFAQAEVDLPRGSFAEPHRFVYAVARNLHPDVFLQGFVHYLIMRRHHILPLTSVYQLSINYLAITHNNFA